MLRAILSAVATLSVALGPALPVSSGPSTDEIEVRDDVFDPATFPGPGQVRTPGVSVSWEWDDAVEHPHNVRQLGGLFRSEITAEPTFSFERRFSAGSFPYECEIHGPSMSGTVRVVIGQDQTLSGLPIITWADEITNTGRAFDVQFRIGDGRWRLWKKDTENFQGVFGRNDRPVQYESSKEYWFRARSQKRADTPNKVSRWSPARLFD
jgi:plastocyanin